LFNIDQHYSLIATQVIYTSVFRINTDGLSTCYQEMPSSQTVLLTVILWWKDKVMSF